MMAESRIGLFVSDDELSMYVYEKLKNQGMKVYPISFAPCNFVKSHLFPFGDISGIVEYLVAEKIKNLVFIGRVSAASLFTGISSLDTLFKKEGILSGEVVLKNLASFLKKKGIEIKKLTDILKDELAENKIYTGIPLTKEEKEDINTGTSFLMDICNYRIGQSVAVKKKMIVAVEGVEGTDEMIRRAGKYCNNFVVVKMAGRYKDERFDIPVIGPLTVKTLKKAGGSVIAVEAGKTIIFKSSEVIKLCNKNGIKLIGIKGVI